MKENRRHEEMKIAVVEKHPPRIVFHESIIIGKKLSE